MANVKSQRSIDDNDLNGGSIAMTSNVPAHTLPDEPLGRRPQPLQDQLYALRQNQNHAADVTLATIGPGAGGLGVVGNGGKARYLGHNKG